jgi:hypothetical protein
MFVVRARRKLSATQAVISRRLNYSYLMPSKSQGLWQVLATGSADPRVPACDSLTCGEDSGKFINAQEYAGGQNLTFI